MADNEKVATAVEIHVFVNRKKVTFSQQEATGQQILLAAGFTGSGWDLLKLQGEGDPTGGTLIQSNQVVELKNGEHFRVIPGNRTFGGAR